LSNELSRGSFKLDQFFQECHVHDSIEIEVTGLHMDVLAESEVRLNVVNQVEDVLLEVAVVELAENSHQPDYKVWTVCHLFCLFSCQIEQKRVINELVKGVLSQEHSCQGEVVQIFHQFVHFVEGINVTYCLQASCDVF
jgi:hypothetical protein